MHFRTGFPSMKMHQAADKIMLIFPWHVFHQAADENLLSETLRVGAACRRHHALRFPRAKRFTKQRIGLKGLGI
jgi:hypothetical protein